MVARAAVRSTEPPERNGGVVGRQRMRPRGVGENPGATTEGPAARGAAGAGAVVAEETTLELRRSAGSEAGRGWASTEGRALAIPEVAAGEAASGSRVSTIEEQEEAQSVGRRTAVAAHVQAGGARVPRRSALRQARARRAGSREGPARRAYQRRAKQGPGGGAVRPAGRLVVRGIGGGPSIAGSEQTRRREGLAGGRPARKEKGTREARRLGEDPWQEVVAQGPARYLEAQAGLQRPNRTWEASTKRVARHRQVTGTRELRPGRCGGCTGREVRKDGSPRWGGREAEREARNRQ